jgi:protein gp37
MAVSIREVEKEKNLPAEQRVVSTEQAIAAVRLITLVAMMAVAKGEEDEEDGRSWRIP